VHAIRVFRVADPEHRPQLTHDAQEAVVSERWGVPRTMRSTGRPSRYWGCVRQIGKTCFKDYIFRTLIPMRASAACSACAAALANSSARSCNRSTTIIVSPGHIRTRPCKCPHPGSGSGYFQHTLRTPQHQLSEPLAPLRLGIRSRSASSFQSGAFSVNWLAGCARGQRS
jgi:hypothetical protein